MLDYWEKKNSSFDFEKWLNYFILYDWRQFNLGNKPDMCQSNCYLWGYLLIFQMLDSWEKQTIPILILKNYLIEVNCIPETNMACVNQIVSFLLFTQFTNVRFVRKTNNASSVFEKSLEKGHGMWNSRVISNFDFELLQIDKKLLFFYFSFVLLDVQTESFFVYKNDFQISSSSATDH